MKTLLAVLLLVAAAQAQEVTPAHQYDFSKSLADSMGGPAMESGGGTLYATRYQFPIGAGPSLSNALASPREYTIELVVKLSHVTRYRALVNFDNTKHDRSLFVRDGSVNFYPISSSTQSVTVDMVGNQFHRVVFTRDGATNIVTCYVDGTRCLSATDPTGRYIADGNADGILHFCRDNNGEHSAGELDQIRIYHRALTAAEIAAMPPLPDLSALIIPIIPARPARTLPAAGQQSPILPATKPIAPPPLTRFTDPNPSPHNAFGQTIVALTTGNVVITSPQADIGGVTDCGAVYLFNGSTGALISTLTGTTAYDFVGSGGVTPLTNGNYVVRSQNWDHSGFRDVGAVTWGNGLTGTTGPVTPANGLTGSTPQDRIGFSGVTALPNGNYVVCSATWDYASSIDAGAATWGDGSTGITGPVTAENSLTGFTSHNLVGNGGAFALPNGNYLVLSPAWDHGNTPNVGAVTWANGTVGIVGTVAPDNSLTGTTAHDQAGSGGATAQPNGDYLVQSPNWNNGTGTTTHGDGKTGTHGPLRPATK